MTIRSTALAGSIVCVLAAWPAAAQVVTGVVRIEATTEPARGVWVVLVGADDRPVTGVLTDAAGRFSARAPAGRYTLRAELIGYETALAGPFLVQRAEPVAITLSLRARALPLDAITVEVEQRCEANPESGVAATVWDEARKGLEAVRWTSRGALVTYRVRQYTRVTDLTGRVRESEEKTTVLRAARPFTTPPAEELAEKGFVRDDGLESLFYAPDAGVLLSDAFAATHCFRARRGRGEQAGLVGLSFEPHPRGRADVQGTLWLDAATSELRWIEYRYTGIDYGPRTRELGGRLDFARLESGAWVISSWRIRGPAFARPRAATAREPLSLAGFMEAGGEVVEVLRGGDASD
ncbi:MAG: carboxypeptidase-like regulatory domain-containing protein [Gemmatimonadetes bacterium]|nr:carboxypeptidase-like regulatory domain-containing protein [Gemmatimonadota bacterium]